MDILTPQTESTGPSTSSTGQGVVGQDGHLMPLSGYFNIQNPSGADLDALNYIYKYFNNRVRTIPEMLLGVRGIEQRLGMAALGESRLQQVYKYIKIDAQIADLQNMKQAYER